jgi:hypothetical protein
MLFFYRRLTYGYLYYFQSILADSNSLNLQQQNLVKVTGAVCVAAYIATIIAFLTHCHPIHRLWQLYPYPGDDCALNISKYLALVVTNITWVNPRLSPSHSASYSSLQYRPYDTVYPAVSLVERPATCKKEALIRVLAVHRNFHHDSDTASLHPVSSRCIPNQCWDYLVNPRNGMLPHMLTPLELY